MNDRSVVSHISRTRLRLGIFTLSLFRSPCVDSITTGSGLMEKPSVTWSSWVRLVFTNEELLPLRIMIMNYTLTLKRKNEFNE